MGGKYNVIHQTSSKIMDSFGVDSSAKQDTPLEVQQQVTQTIPQLKIAPKWMKRPCGASFGVNTKRNIQSAVCSRINSSCLWF